MKIKPIIAVVGIGGGGCNAIGSICEMLVEKYSSSFKFVVMNTDSQSLLETEKIAKNLNIEVIPLQLGEDGLGAGSDPEKGRIAAEASSQEIREILQDCDMVVITTGLGGGTGSGATPVVADIVKKELKAVVVVIATKPFTFEGNIRQEIAEQSMEKCIATSDLVVRIANQNLLGVIPLNTPIKKAFKIVDQVCSTFVKGVIDIIDNTGLVNLDFADIKSIIQDGGIGVIGFGEGTGENAAAIAVEAAIKNQLFDVFTSGAKSALVHIVGNSELSLMDVESIVTNVQKMILTRGARIIYGAAVDANLGLTGEKEKKIDEIDFSQFSDIGVKEEEFPNKIIRVMIIAVANVNSLDEENNFQENIGIEEEEPRVSTEEKKIEEPEEGPMNLLNIISRRWKDIK